MCSLHIPGRMWQGPLGRMAVLRGIMRLHKMGLAVGRLRALEWGPKGKRVGWEGKSQAVGIDYACPALVVIISKGRGTAARLRRAPGPFTP